MDPSTIKIPPIRNQNADTITENTILINSNNPDARFRYVLERLVVHLHDFARETRLSTKEWMSAINFLTDVGKICSDVRQEFILLSDVFGLSLLVDSIDHPKPPASTEGTVLGPFHTHEAHEVPSGESISQDVNGEPLLVICTIKNTAGEPIQDVKVDIWETDSTGHYDVQHADYDGPDGRCVMLSDKDGLFWFKGIVPVPYPIPRSRHISQPGTLTLLACIIGGLRMAVPHDGPVGKFLKRVHRHPYRPAHMHFMFAKAGYDNLITALYLRGDPYEASDAVFGVKDSLIVDMPALDAETAERYGVKAEERSRWRVLSYDFVLVTEKEASDLRDQNSMKALEKLGKRVQIIGGLPVPEVD